MNYIMFDHEKLHVYQKSLDFIEWSDRLLAKIRTKIKVLEHLDNASTSISLNIAEGNGIMITNEILNHTLNHNLFLLFRRKLNA